MREPAQAPKRIPPLLVEGIRGGTTVHPTLTLSYQGEENTVVRPAVLFFGLVMISLWCTHPYTRAQITDDAERRRHRGRATPVDHLPVRAA